MTGSVLLIKMDRIYLRCCGTCTNFSVSGSWIRSVPRIKMDMVAWRLGICMEYATLKLCWSTIVPCQ